MWITREVEEDILLIYYIRVAENGMCMDGQFLTFSRLRTSFPRSVMQ